MASCTLMSMQRRERVREGEKYDNFSNMYIIGGSMGNYLLDNILTYIIKY